MQVGLQFVSPPPSRQDLRTRPVSRALTQPSFASGEHCFRRWGPTSTCCGSVPSIGCSFCLEAAAARGDRPTDWGGNRKSSREGDFKAARMPETGRTSTRACGCSVTVPRDGMCGTGLGDESPLGRNKKKITVGILSLAVANLGLNREGTRAAGAAGRLAKEGRKEGGRGHSFSGLCIRVPGGGGGIPAHAQSLTHRSPHSLTLCFAQIGTEMQAARGRLNFFS